MWRLLQFATIIGVAENETAYAATAQTPTVALPSITPPSWMVATVIVAVVVFILLTLLVIRSGLALSASWKLGDALSEEADLTNSAGVPVKEMRASSSRLIAFIGLIILSFLYLGFGIFILFYFATGQKLPPDLNDIENFMLAGLAMFAPYAVNQLRAAMQGLTSVPSPTPQTNASTTQVTSNANKI